MAIKQTASKTSSKVTAEKAPKVASAAPAEKPRTSRVTSAKHSKTVAAEPVAEKSAAVKPAESKNVNAAVENPQEAIAKIAYGYWESRGYQAGDQNHDWLRAEAEYSSRSL